jgi:hypothetical protein
MGDHIFIEKRN